MPTPCSRLVAAWVLAWLLAAGAFLSRPALGQFTSFHAPNSPARDGQTNLFATWAGTERADGLLVELPPGWSLEGVSLLRRGYEQVEAEIHRLDDRRYRVAAGRSLDVPHEIVLTVGVGDGAAAERVAVTPLVRTRSSYAARSVFRVERTLHSAEPVTDADNRVLSFSHPRAQPLHFRLDRVPELSLSRAFSVSMWIRTIGLGEVILSTWNGDEYRPYPLEIVVDAAGRLRSFRGRHGEHQSLVSDVPVADGAWHQVSVTNSPSDGWIRLWVDGTTVDSIYAPAPLGISNTLPLALGGRNDRTGAYFDGLKPYTGAVDELHVAHPEEGGRVFRVAFEDAVAPELLQEQASGLRYETSNLVLRRPIEAFRASPAQDGVLISWRSTDRQAAAFVVERSSDGRSFITVERIPSQNRNEYQILDRGTSDGVAYYRVRQIFRQGADRVSGTLKVGLGAEKPKIVVLFGNFPNPFNAATTITYELRENMNVHLAVWDLAGQPVATLVNRRQGPGVFETRFEAGDLPSGTYFVRLRTSEGIESHKMILTK